MLLYISVFVDDTNAEDLNGMLFFNHTESASYSGYKHFVRNFFGASVSVPLYKLV